MKKGRVLCLSGICLIAVAFVLALSGAHACTVLDPTELADIYGGQCDQACETAVGWVGCAPYEETGLCEPQGGNCPDEQKRTSCQVDEYRCIYFGWRACEESYVDCQNWYQFYQCEKDNKDGTCYWWPGQMYPCWERDPGEYIHCEYID